MKDDTKHSPTPWKLRRGFSDWGMPCQHDIYLGDGDKDEDYIAGVPSVTPYCIGSSQKDRDYSARQWEYARHIVRCVNGHDELVESLEAVANDLDAAMLDGREHEVYNAVAMAIVQARAALARVRQ